ncbi:tetratricopeptide repeat protein [PVC group bacterium]|nr:tetratricopeptide repeat protein [PVC group bacterium]
MTMRLLNVMNRRVTSTAIALLFTMVFCGQVFAQGLGEGGLTPEQELELRYADGLLKYGLADYSKNVIATLNLPPEIMTMRKIKTFCALGEFDKANSIIDRRPDKSSQGTWTLRLTLADGYYAWGKFVEAQKIYQGFFDKYPNGPSKQLNQFYLESAYKYAQMLIIMGDKKKAVTAYETALKADMERYVSRQLEGELAEILLKLGEESTGAEREKYFEKTSKIIDKLLWVQDLWFGKAIVMMAHMKKLKGDVDGATQLIEDYKSQLIAIDKQLKESATPDADLTKLSPMAQCRYMIGTIMQEEADRILEKEPAKRAKAFELYAGAIKHLLNVFIRYPNTNWAPDAGTRSEEIKEILQRVFNKEVKTNISKEQWAAVESAQFREARVLFNQSQFKEAAASYEKVLKVFPESDTAVQALGELANCYIELEKDLYAEVTIRYIAERFNKNDEFSNAAGDQVIRLAFTYSENQKPERMRACYDAFFTFFHNHPRTVGELFRFGEKSLHGKDYENALRYYNMIAEGHQDNNLYYDALSRIAQCYSDTGKTEEELKALNVLVAKLEEKDKPGHALVNAIFRKVTALKKKDDEESLELAVQGYKDLEKLLEDKEKRLQYQNSMDEAKQNEMILQASMFNRALADSRRKTVSKKVQAYFDKKYGKKVPPETILNAYYKTSAIKTLLRLADEFPESAFSPPSLSQAGALYTILNKPEDAKKAFQRLQKDYPESPEAENVQFMLANSLLGMGRRKEAIREFKKIFDAPAGTYKPGQMLTVGKEMLKVSEYELSAQAFDQVIKSAKKRGYLEPARAGKGESLCALAKYEEAAKVLGKFLDDYPNSGYTVEVCKNFSRSCAEVAKKTEDGEKRFTLFNDGVTAMKRARKYAKAIAVKTELDVGVARILVLKADAEHKFGKNKKLAAEKADKYLNNAIAAYQGIIMFRDPKTEEGVGPHLEDAYVECLPLLLQVEKYNDAFQDAERYSKLFPRGKHALKVRQYLNKARVGGGSAKTDLVKGEK